MKILSPLPVNLLSPLHTHTHTYTRSLDVILLVLILLALASRLGDGGGRARRLLLDHGSVAFRARVAALVHLIRAFVSVAVFIHGVKQDEDAEGGGRHDADYHARGAAGLPDHLHGAGAALLHQIGGVSCGHMREVRRVGEAGSVAGGRGGGQEHLVAGVHFARGDVELVGVSGGRGDRGAVAARALAPAFAHRGGRWQDRPIGDHGGVFVKVLVVGLRHFSGAERRHLHGVATVLLVGRAWWAGVGQNEGLFGGLERGQGGGRGGDSGVTGGHGKGVLGVHCNYGQH